MRILSLSVENYRTLERLSLNFPSFYSAICGRNDSGKTNIVRAIRCLMHEDEPWGLIEGRKFSYKDDFTKWIEIDPKKCAIFVKISLEINDNRDTALYSFLLDYLNIDSPTSTFELQLEVQQNADESQEVKVNIQEKKFDGLKAQEVLKRLQTSQTFLFHNSTETTPRSRKRYRGILRDISEENARKLEASKASVNKILQRIGKDQQKEIEELLGRLKEKYKVGVSLPPFDPSHFPFALTLGDQKIDIDLENWGSGTRNRTQILLTIFQAKKVVESSISTAKVTPIIVVEEPESFLHPLAQAEFGSLLQDLAEEFKVQIIVTTHSPYLLSHKNPEANILLERRSEGHQLRQTEQIDTSGERWMEPFALSLGMSDVVFSPWRKLFFSESKSILLVEGKIDKAYIELLQNPAHGEQKLNFEGEIFDYGGSGTLSNQNILRFLKDKFPNIFITYDLDIEQEIEKKLSGLNFEKKKHYLPLGIPYPGKRRIEGLLPERIRQTVQSDYPDLVDALSGTAEERKRAECSLKKLYFERFKIESQPGEEDYAEFYKVTKIINQAIRKWT